MIKCMMCGRHTPKHELNKLYFCEKCVIYAIQIVAKRGL